MIEIRSSCEMKLTLDFSSLLSVISPYFSSSQAIIGVLTSVPPTVEVFCPKCNISSSLGSAEIITSQSFLSPKLYMASSLTSLTVSSCYRILRFSSDIGPCKLLVPIFVDDVLKFTRQPYLPMPPLNFNFICFIKISEYYIF